MRVLALILLSAGAHALAFPPFGIAPLGFVAVAPFLVAIRRLSPGRAAWAGHLWGSVAIWGVGYWVAEALTFYYEQPWWFGVLFCIVGCQILWGAYYALFAGCARWALPRVEVAWRPLATAVLWVACELARARLLTGEPWMLLGYSLVPSEHLIQVADLGGVYLLSFAVIFVNASIAELVLTSPGMRRAVAVRLVGPALLLLVAISAYGALRLEQVFDGGSPLRVTVVQGNNDLGAQWKPEFYGAGLQVYTRLSRAAAVSEAPDLFVWPESAVTFFFAHEPRYRATVSRELGDLGADVIVGAPHHEDGESYFNSAFYITPDGAVAGRYDKGHLLPFGEYFPLRFLSFLRRHFERVRTFTPGDDQVLLPTRAGPAAAVICFEAIFPEIVRAKMQLGATFLVNLSNDVWLGRGSGQAQHLAMVVLRAVENRTWVVRATTTGHSAFVDPWGRVRAVTRMNEEATLTGEIVPMRVETIYKGWGDWFAYGCVVAALMTVMWVMIRCRGSLSRQG